jgi:hypothetical protein
MGAWGFDTFDNDAACDWKYELEESDDLSVIERAISAVLNDDEEYLDADLGAAGLADCDALARLRGNWGVRNAYTESLDAWVEAHRHLTPSPDLLRRALAAIDRIRGESSELAAVWDEGDSKDQWHKAVDALRGRLLRTQASANT